MNREGEEAASKGEIKDKGKDVERKRPSSPTRQDGPAPVEASPSLTSIVSRLGASTSRLANDMIPWNLHSDHVADALPSHKAEPSGASQYSGANGASSYKNSSTQAIADGTFKSFPAREGHVNSESDFSTFLDGTSIPEETEPASTKLCGYEQSHEPGAFSRQTVQTAAIAQSDGMDVVDFLDSGYNEVEETAMILTDDERIALRRRLFEDKETENTAGTRQLRQWDNALNFFPGTGLDNHSIQEYTDLFGTSDVEEAKSLWINQWRDVLSSYTDEVWGDLNPLVSLAREEVRPSRPSEDASLSPSKLKALRRLQTILAHIRGV
ncbi:Dynamin- GTPase protein [Hypoxylon texense]